MDIGCRGRRDAYKWTPTDVIDVKKKSENGSKKHMGPRTTKRANVSQKKINQNESKVNRSKRGPEY